MANEKKDFYNKFWEDKSFKQIKNSFHNQERRKRILKYVKKIIKKRKVNKVLEIGCGVGVLTDEIGNILEADIIAIDISSSPRKIWNQIEKKHANIKFITADFLDHQFEKESFDIIICSEVIEHVKYSQQKEFIDKIYSLLKKGGYLILTTPNGPYVLKNMEEHEKQIIEDQLGPQELRDLIEKAGFEIEYQDLFFPDLKKLWTYKIARKLHLIRLVFQPYIFPIISKYKKDICIYQFLVAQK